jgi:hypothetical protein
LRSDDGVPGSSTLACFASSEIPITSESSAVTSSPSLTQREPISEIKNDSMLSLCIPTGFGEFGMAHVADSILEPVFINMLYASQWNLFTILMAGLRNMHSDD